MNYRLGIDLGTSYFKLGLFDPDLHLRGIGRVEVPVRSGDNRAEVAVDAFWQTLRQGLEQALEGACARVDEISALSWSSQANSYVLLDGAANPLTPLILWTDTRAPEVPDVVRGLADRPDFVATTGLGCGLGRHAAVSKLVWMQRHDPALWRRTVRVLTISDYLSFALTGRFQGDAGTASLLGLLDQRALAWWPDAVTACGLSLAQLATPLRPGTVVGGCTEAGGSLLGLPSGARVSAGTLDHHAAALGAGLGACAPVSESTGTVLACVGLSDDYRPRAGVCHLPGTEPNAYALLVFDGNGAGVLEWYRRAYAPELTFQELDRLAAAVPPDCDGLTARPQAHLQPGLAGFDNRQPDHGHGHYARAIMTASADTLGLLLDRLCPEGRPGRVVATGGGAHSPFWLQLKRERLGIDIVAAACREPACRGAALLAARGDPA
ncbi:MAG: FGGY-family carbohydrate kinase [Lentisphaerae bacterium]|nr:FGGY-family carbohydrate kinase [Lentisphaerota bacterium]